MIVLECNHSFNEKCYNEFCNKKCPFCSITSNSYYGFNMMDCNDSIYHSKKYTKILNNNNNYNNHNKIKYHLPSKY